MSTDDAHTLLNFQTKLNAPQQMVSDVEHKIVNAYGVAFGMGNLTVAKRQTFVIGKDGRILFTYFDWSPLTNVNKTYEWLKAHPQN